MSQERSDFRQTLREAAGRAGAAEPTQAGHPDLDRLAAYHDGSLPEPEAERVREHLALCRECADLLLDYRDFAREEPAGAASATAAAWERDRERVREAVRRRAEPGSVVEPAEAAEPGRAYTGPRRGRLAPGLAAAFAAASVVLGILWWQARLELQRPRPVELAYVEPEGSSTLRSPAGEVEVPAGPDSRPVVLLYLTEPADFPRYEARIVPPAGDGSARTLELAPGADGVFALQLGAEPEPGDYRVVLSGVADGERRELATFRFRVREADS